MSDLADKLKATFKEFDTNTSHRVTREELENVLVAANPSMTWTQSELKLLMDSVDKNGDGFIDYDEFTDFVCSVDDDDDAKPKVKLGIAIFDVALLYAEQRKTEKSIGKESSRAALMETAFSQAAELAGTGRHHADLSLPVAEVQDELTNALEQKWEEFVESVCFTVSTFHLVTAKIAEAKSKVNKEGETAEDQSEALYTKAREKAGGAEALEKNKALSADLVREVELRNLRDKQDSAFESLNMVRLMSDAERALPLFNDFLNMLSTALLEQGVKSMKLVAPRKQYLRSKRKVDQKFAGDVSWLADLVRGTLVIIGGFNDLYKALNTLVRFDFMSREVSKVVWVADRFQRPLPKNYGDVNVGLQLQNHLCELQVTVLSMFEAKEGVCAPADIGPNTNFPADFTKADGVQSGHGPYETQRELDESLLLATCENLPQLCQSLLEAKASPGRISDKNGLTALHHAAFAGANDLAISLLQHTADPWRHDYQKNLPLKRAIFTGDTELLDNMLLAMEAKAPLVSDIENMGSGRQLFEIQCIALDRIDELGGQSERIWRLLAPYTSAFCLYAYAFSIGQPLSLTRLQKANVKPVDYTLKVMGSHMDHGDFNMIDSILKQGLDAKDWGISSGASLQEWRDVVHKNGFMENIRMVVTQMQDEGVDCVFRAFNIYCIDEHNNEIKVETDIPDEYRIGDPNQAMDQALFAAMEHFLGHYECREYIGTPDENGWHRVMIIPAEANAVKHLDSAPLRWRNEANCQWSLTPCSDGQSFTVGQDCPYFEDGHQVCRSEMEGPTLVLIGPGNERYYRTGDLPPEMQQASWAKVETSPDGIGGYENPLYKMKDGKLVLDIKLPKPLVPVGFEWQCAQPGQQPAKYVIETTDGNLLSTPADGPVPGADDWSRWTKRMNLHPRCALAAAGDELALKLLKGGIDAVCISEKRQHELLKMAREWHSKSAELFNRWARVHLKDLASLLRIDVTQLIQLRVLSLTEEEVQEEKELQTFLFGLSLLVHIEGVRLCKVYIGKVKLGDEGILTVMNTLKESNAPISSIDFQENGLTDNCFPAILEAASQIKSMQKVVVQSSITDETKVEMENQWEKYYDLHLVR